MRGIFAILVLVVLFGCLVQEPSVPPSVPNSTIQPPVQQVNNSPAQLTCEEYCYSAITPSCDGNWSISGVYPNCNCNFDCVVISNTTEPNITEPIEVPEANFSELLDIALDKISDGFYLNHSGTFTENKYTWRRMITDGTIIDTSTPEVKFNGVSMDSLQSSGYFIFHGDDLKEVYGVAIFNDEDPFEEYGINDGFDVYYVPKLIQRTLIDCTVYNKENPTTLVVAYYFKCENED
ncbi:MAG: hypothetical protein ABH842_06140 [Candidatus Micrarchaeota archaeon]